MARFNQTSTSVLKSLGHLHPKRLQQKDVQSHLQVAASWYQNDIDSFQLSCEVQMIQHSKLLEKSNSIMELYRTIAEEIDCFPNLIRLLRIALTIPITSASAERSFSKLKLIKSKLRTTMTQERLQCLMLMSVEKDIQKSLNVHELVEKFASTSHRRMNLY